MEGGGFEPPKASPTDLQSVPFGRSGTPPWIFPSSLLGASEGTRTPDRLITNQLLYQTELRWHRRRAKICKIVNKLDDLFITKPRPHMYHSGKLFYLILSDIQIKSSKHLLIDIICHQICLGTNSSDFATISIIFCFRQPISLTHSPFTAQLTWFSHSVT